MHIYITQIEYRKKKDRDDLERFLIRCSRRLFRITTEE